MIVVAITIINVVITIIVITIIVTCVIADSYCSCCKHLEPRAAFKAVVQFLTLCLKLTADELGPVGIPLFTFQLEPEEAAGRRLGGQEDRRTGADGPGGTSLSLLLYRLRNLSSVSCFPRSSRASNCISSAPIGKKPREKTAPNREWISSLMPDIKSYFLKNLGLSGTEPTLSAFRAEL